MIKQHLVDFDSQIAEGLRIGRQFTQSFQGRKFRKIILWGIGGSAMSGDLLRVIIEAHSNLFFFVHRNTYWPRWVGRDTFVIFSSYSGNSQEVLRAVQTAPIAGKNMMAVTSGGQLGKYACRKRIPCVQVPGGIPPRSALGYLAFSVLPVLEKVGKFKVPHHEIREMLALARTVGRREAKSIAKKLVGKSVCLYGVSGVIEPALIRWRAQLAENAKMLASHHLFPEAFHNEIEGWKNPKSVIRNTVAVFLEDRGDGSELARKREAAARFIQRQGGHVVWVSSRGKSPLARLVSLVCLGDWVSYELARLNRTDPLPIPTITFLKKVR